jgi:hypothetical protein
MKQVIGKTLNLVVSVHNAITEIESLKPECKQHVELAAHVKRLRDLCGTVLKEIERVSHADRP